MHDLDLVKGLWTPASLVMYIPLLKLLQTGDGFFHKSSITCKTCEYEGETILLCEHINTHYIWTIYHPFIFRLATTKRSVRKVRPVQESQRTQHEKALDLHILEWFFWHHSSLKELVEYAIARLPSMILHRTYPPKDRSKQRVFASITDVREEWESTSELLEIIY